MSPAEVEDRNPNILTGIIILVLGLLFLMETFDILDFGSVFANWWPLIIVAVGLFKLRGQDKTGGMIVLLIGLVFLSATLDIVEWGNLFRFWPVILIAVGLSLILKGRDRKWWGSVSSKETSDGFIKASVILGGLDRVVKSENFQGGDISSIFGGAKLDLRDAKTAEENCYLNLKALFGGIEIILPPGWQVSVSGTPILGAIEDKTRRTESQDKKTVVHLQCTVAFGAIEIKN